MKTLLLWDIDGTLVNSGGAGLRALTRALKAGFDVDGLLQDMDFGGRTDGWITRQIFARFSLPATKENFSRLFDAYVQILPTELAKPAAHVLPGIETLLASAARHPGISQGLLTGNIRRAAEVKLAFHGLWDYFPFGAFADDAELRDELGPHAVRRAADHNGAAFPADRVWIIGDTPHDIACGRAIGARTLAVATGSSSSAKLSEQRPTALFENLTDEDAFFRAVLS